MNLPLPVHNTGLQAGYIIKKAVFASSPISKVLNFELLSNGAKKVLG